MSRPRVPSSVLERTHKNFCFVGGPRSSQDCGCRVPEFRSQSSSTFFPDVDGTRYLYVSRAPGRSSLVIRRASVQPPDTEKPVAFVLSGYLSCGPGPTVHGTPETCTTGERAPSRTRSRGGPVGVTQEAHRRVYEERVPFTRYRCREQSDPSPGFMSKITGARTGRTVNLFGLGTPPNTYRDGVGEGPHSGTIDSGPRLGHGPSVLGEVVVVTSLFGLQTP